MPDPLVPVLYTVRVDYPPLGWTGHCGQCGSLDTYWVGPDARHLAGFDTLGHAAHFHTRPQPAYTERT